jgi:hypothetical protein
MLRPLGYVRQAMGHLGKRSLTAGVKNQWAVAQNQDGLAEASLILNKAASRQECPKAFRLEVNAVQSQNLLSPNGIHRQKRLAGKAR